MQSGIPQSARRRLQDVEVRLREGDFHVVRIVPLALKGTLSELLRRRERLYSHLAVQPEGWGFSIRFTRVLRGRHGSEGRSVGGQFDVVALGGERILLVSALGADAQAHGPGRLAEGAYPIAERPFVTSRCLHRLVSDFAGSADTQVVATDTVGYAQEGHGFRRDTKHQALDRAFREMGQQDRQVHRVTVIVGQAARSPSEQVSLDRWGTAAILKGSPTRLVDAFVLPVLDQHAAQRRNFAAVRAAPGSGKSALNLVFRERVFASAADMQTLCSCVRTAAGLGVSLVHLNPYLYAQVIDYLTGASVLLAVLDPKMVSVMPRSGDAEGLIGRVVQAILHDFGDADVSVG